MIRAVLLNTGSEKPNKSRLFWWTNKGSNLGPLPCEGNALPLSYASGILLHDQRPAGGVRSEKYTSVTAIYEAQALGVKLSARNHAEASGRLLLAGTGGVGLQRPGGLRPRPPPLAVAPPGRPATPSAPLLPGR